MAQQRRQQPPGPADPERAERDASAALALVEQQRRDQEAGDDEEHLDAVEPAGHPGEARRGRRPRRSTAIARSPSSAGWLPNRGVHPAARLGTVPAIAVDLEAPVAGASVDIRDARRHRSIVAIRRPWLGSLADAHGRRECRGWAMGRTLLAGKVALITGGARGQGAAEGAAVRRGRSDGGARRRARRRRRADRRRDRARSTSTST